DAAPSLDPPALVPPSTEPAAPASAPHEVQKPPENRPLLVIPGVTAPLPPKPVNPASRPKARAANDLSGPALTPPASPRAGPPSGPRSAQTDRTSSHGVVIPLTLEPITEELPPGPNPGQIRASKPTRSSGTRPGETARPSRGGSADGSGPSRSTST